MADRDGDDGRSQFTCPDCGENNALAADSIDGSAMQAECKICGTPVLAVKRFEENYKIFRLKMQFSD
jgi:transcription elongation factor Elf1